MVSMYSETQRAKQLADMVRSQLGTDDYLAEVIASTVEGETGLLEAIDKVIVQALELEANAESLKALKADMDSRKARLEERASRLRQSVFQVLSELGMDTEAIRRPAFTLSFSTQKPKPIVQDAALLPADCVEQVVTLKPKLDAIKSRIEAGEAVAGVAMSNGGRSMSVRVK